MKYDSVIFDLFGTLVDNIPDEAFERVQTQMAAILQAPEEDFARLWSIDTYVDEALLEEDQISSLNCRRR
jgi:FMN phosphatase YigB (HAD superfamily)